MSNGYYISIFLSAAGTILMILVAILWHYRGCKHKFRELLKDIKRILLAPIYYFWGWSCPVCKKTYLSSKKAHSCCAGPHNDYKGGPPKRITPKVNPDDYLRTCPWCEGTGRKFGVMCDTCNGTGKIFRDMR